MSTGMTKTSVLDGVPRLPQWIAQMHDVTATRAVDTPYRNNYGRPILCIVTVLSLRANVAAACAYCTVNVDDVTPPLNNITHGGFAMKDNNPDEGYFCMAFLVPTGLYYQVSTAVIGVGSSITLMYWIEVVI